MTDALLLLFKQLVHINLNLAILVLLAWAILGRGKGLRTTFVVWGVLAVRFLLEPFLCPEKLATTVDFTQGGLLSVGFGLTSNGETLVANLVLGDSRQRVGDLTSLFLGESMAVFLGGVAAATLALSLLYRCFALYLARGDEEGLKWSPEAVTPHISGWWRSALVLPTALRDDLSKSELEAVLAHERAHLDHGDPKWFALLYFLRGFCCVVWPLAIILDGLEQTLERRCDLIAAKQVGAKAVARALTHLATSQRSSALQPAFAVSAVQIRVRALRPGLFKESFWAIAAAITLLGAVFL